MILQLCNNDDGAYQMVQNIIMNHHVFSKQWQHRNEDWQFVLLACQTLLHTINSDKLSKGIERVLNEAKKGNFIILKLEIFALSYS